MTVTSAPAQTADDHALADRGRWCAGAGVIGVLQAAVLLAWPHQVAATRFSFPLTAAGYVVAQATFFLQHLPLALAVATLAGRPAVRRLRTARRALLTATAGLGLLAVTELAAMAAATATNDSTLGTTIDLFYSVPVLLTGVGLTVAGIALVRRPVLGTTVAWTTLALGVFVFVGLTPALASDAFVAGRLAIMAWMVAFAVLGLAMMRCSDDSPHRGR